MVYPRQTGHCASHYIPADVMSHDDNEEPMENKKLDEMLLYLRDKKTDLIRGDLIVLEANAEYRNDGVYIYNGVRILNLEFDNEFDDYGYLPREFRVIEAGVPLDYWEHRGESYPNPIRGIDHNYLVWFEPRDVIDECVNNICYSRLDTGEYNISTTFTYCGRQYHILYDYSEYDDDFTDEYMKINSNDTAIDLQKHFRGVLLDTTGPLSFTTRSDAYENLKSPVVLFLQYH